MGVLSTIAIRHLLARKRQSFVSIMGIVLGGAFFLAISSLMRGSEQDFIRRLVDNTPHITITDEFRNARPQPLLQRYPNAAISIRGVKPVTETRGIRGYDQILARVRATEGAQASAVLTGQAVVTYAGKDVGITLYGMVPQEIREILTIRNYMVEGSLDNLIANPEGIIVGTELARKLALNMNDSISVASSIGQVRSFKIVGTFRTGRADFDEHQTFVVLKRAQSLFNRPFRINNIIVKIPDPTKARNLSSDIERAVGYKSVSWQESSEDLMNTLSIRNTIMYTVVSAVLIVAAFGIYNVISTVVIEKHRDIAILKSMGFYARDIERIFLIQGIVLGVLGNLIGLPLGSLFIYALGQVQFRPPGVTDMVQMPVSWEGGQFLVAGLFALFASVAAAFFPARKGSRVQPVQILRGGQ